MEEPEIMGPLLEAARKAALKLYDETGGNCTLEQLTGVIEPLADQFEGEYSLSSLRLMVAGQLSAFIFEWVTVLPLTKALDERSGLGRN